MKVSILVATYGEMNWFNLARERARPSAWIQGADQVYLHHTENGTIGNTRNRAAEHAKGDWLCFLDADDELAPGYLEAMRQAYERESRDDGTPLLLTPAVQKIVKGRVQRPVFYPKVDLRAANWLIIGTLIQRDLFMEVGGFEDYPHGFEDYSLWSKAYRAGARVVEVPKAVYVQHVNPQSKHRVGWRNKKWQHDTHVWVNEQLDAWEAARSVPA